MVENIQFNKNPARGKVPDVLKKFQGLLVKEPLDDHQVMRGLMIGRHLCW